MPKKAPDLTGLRVGYLTATRCLGSDGRRTLWETRCGACGVLKPHIGSELKKMLQRGVIASCGCMKKNSIGAKNRTHGMSHHPAYAVWRSMLDRCRLPTHQAWKNYGARGIKVCTRWASFQAFWEDMGPTYKTGLTLERKNNNGPYNKANCLWDSMLAQANNRRLTLRTEATTLAALAREHGINYSTLYYRWTVGVRGVDLIAKPDSTRTFMTS